MKNETLFLSRRKVITGVPGMKRQALDIKITASKSCPSGHDAVVGLCLHVITDEGETKAEMSIEMTEDDAKELRDSLDRMISHRP